jgi:hypothetical protein
MMHWLIYGGVVWVALVGFFWCVLAIAARADRRDAQTDQSATATTRRPPHHRARAAPVGREAGSGAACAPDARPDTDQALSAAREIEAIRPRGLGDPPRDRDGGLRPPTPSVHPARTALTSQGSLRNLDGALLARPPGARRRRWRCGLPSDRGDATPRGALPTPERRQRPRRSSEVAGHRLGPARWPTQPCARPVGVARGPKLGSDRHWLRATA